MSIYDRSIALLGEDAISKLHNKTVAVIGLGGVGGTALECLARSGIKNFIIIDKDIVDETNLNRQILYTYKDIGKKKTICAKEHILSIIPDANIVILDCLINKENIIELDKYEIDYVIDAIDMIESKIDIYEYCLIRNIPFIASLGMGNRIEPNKLIETTLNKSEGDPLAKKLRSELRKRSIDLKQVHVILSQEKPIVNSIKPTSMMMVPSSCGLLIAKCAIIYLIK